MRGQAAVLDTRFLIVFWEWTVYKCFLFLLQIFQKERIHPQRFLISKIYQWVYGYTKRENAHTISKYVQVVCELKLANSLYTQRLVVPAILNPEHKENSRSSAVWAGPCSPHDNIQSQ